MLGDDLFVIEQCLTYSKEPLAVSLDTSVDVSQYRSVTVSRCQSMEVIG